VRTLPGSAYSSPEVFAAEQEHIFETMWMCALRASELPGPGDFQTVQVGRESIVVSRNRKGPAACLLQPLPPPWGAGLQRGERQRQALVGQRITYDVKANWRLIVENFMECYHCATTHLEPTEVLPEFANGLAAQYFVGRGAEFGEDVQCFTVDGSGASGASPV